MEEFEFEWEKRLTKEPVIRNTPSSVIMEKVEQKIEKEVNIKKRFKPLTIFVSFSTAFLLLFGFWLTRTQPNHQSLVQPPQSTSLTSSAVKNKNDIYKKINPSHTDVYTYTDGQIHILAGGKPNAPNMDELKSIQKRVFDSIKDQSNSGSKSHPNMKSQIAFDAANIERDFLTRAINGQFNQMVNNPDDPGWSYFKNYKSNSNVVYLTNNVTDPTFQSDMKSMLTNIENGVNNHDINQIIKGYQIIHDLTVWDLCLNNFVAPLPTYEGINVYFGATKTLGIASTN